MPPAFKQIVYLTGAALLGQNMLAVRAAKLVEGAVYVNVIQRSSDTVGWKAKQAEHEAGKFKIAIMAGNEDCRAVGEQEFHHLSLVVNGNIISPVGIVNFARRVHDFGNQQEEMLPHAAF